MKLKNFTRILRSIFGWILIVMGGISGITLGIYAFLALFGGTETGSFGERLILFVTALVMSVGFFAILRMGIRLKNRVREKKTTCTEKRKSSPANQRETSLPKKLKQESDIAKEQKISAEQAEMTKIYRDFIAGEGKLPEGFSQEYNTTTPSGYILRETPFKEYLDEIWERVDLLNNRSGFSDWIYFDGHIEINAAIELITDWARLHRKMHARLHEKGLHFINPIYCTCKIMVVLESGDTFRNVAEKSLESCKAEEISFCTILSEYELYDLIEHKAKKITYITYPNYHDETYADWWLVDSDKKVPEEQRPEEELQKKEPEKALTFHPSFGSALKGYQMKMHTDSGEKYCFTLTGLKGYEPNMSSRCGYGSDDWCFHCKYNGENYILCFSDNAGYGTSWYCALIDKENAEQLEKLPVVEWLKLMSKSENTIYQLHPDTIDAAKNIVQDTSLRCGPISDHGFYGQ